MNEDEHPFDASLKAELTRLKKEAEETCPSDEEMLAMLATQRAKDEAASKQGTRLSFWPRIQAEWLLNWKFAGALIIAIAVAAILWPRSGQVSYWEFAQVTERGTNSPEDAVRLAPLLHPSSTNSARQSCGCGRTSENQR